MAFHNPSSRLFLYSLSAPGSVLSLGNRDNLLAHVQLVLFYSVRLYPGGGGNLRRSDTSVQTIIVFSKSPGGGPLRLYKYPASLKFLPLIGASISGPWLYQAVFFAA